MQRRQFVTATGVALSGLLAGCSGESSEGDGESGGGTETEASMSSEGSQTATETDTSYSVTMPPVGEVTFEEVPETWVANNGSWADMGIALGLDAPEGVWLPSRYHTHYYDDIPGVSVDGDALTKLYDDGLSRETFYELDGDVHVMDPNFVVDRLGMKEAHATEISENVGPFFGNSIFSTGYDWHDYEYLTLYEAFEKLAQVFQRTDRYEAFAELHDEFQSEVSDVVPEDESQRPEVAVMWAAGNEPTKFSPYLIEEGTSFKQWRDLGVRDAFAESDVKDFHSDRGRIDFETLLDVDPDVLLVRGHENQSRTEFEDTLVSFLEGHDSGSELTAVQNGEVYRGGPLYQGPITNLLLTERAANQVYGVDTALFDRQRVADIVAGDI